MNIYFRERCSNAIYNWIQAPVTFNLLMYAVIQLSVLIFALIILFESVHFLIAFNDFGVVLF